MHPSYEQPGGPTPNQRKLANKYNSVEDMERGYMELQSVSQATYNKLQDLERKLNEMERMNPAAEAEKRRDPRQELEDIGVPPDAIAELVRAETERFLQPVIQSQEVRKRISAQYENFEELEALTGQFLEANPELKARYQRMYQADIEGAMDWAISTYKRATRDNARPSPDDGRIPGGFNGGPRGADNYYDAEAEAKAREYARQTGDWGRVISERIKLPDSFYEGPNNY